MISTPSPALAQALALIRSPRGDRPGPEERLPDGMELLIRIVAGDAQAMSLAEESTGETRARLRESAAFYIQQVMFSSDSSSYRVLGLDSDASDERLKSHYRWLTRWLHPDRNPDEWEALYSERVNRAWQDLRSSERRQRYDESRAGVLAAEAFEPQAHSRANRIVVSPPDMLDGVEPSVNLRWVPQAIFGGLALSAIVVVSLFYVVHTASPPPAQMESSSPDESVAAESNAFHNARLANPIPAPAASQGVTSTRVVEAPMPAVAQTPVALTVDPGGVKSVPAESRSRASLIPAGAPVDVPAPAAATVSAVPRNAVVMRGQPAPSSGADQGQPSIPAQTPALVPVVDNTEPQAVAPAAPASQREANRLLGQLSQVYAQGDLAGMRAMFTADASSPDGGLDSIMDEYDHLFARTSQRVLAVRDVDWVANGDTLTITAGFEATLRNERGNRSRSHGSLRLELRRQNDRWLIYRFAHRD